MDQATHHAADAASAAIGIKVLALGGIFSAGVLGAALIAAFDPPPTRRLLFAQAAVAGVSSLAFGPAAIKVIDHFVDWIDFTTMAAGDLIEYAAPIYLLIGALSWGGFGALAKLRRLIAERGADALAKKVGLEDEQHTIH